MKRILDSILSAYTTADLSVRMKARFLFVVSIAMLVSLLSGILYTTVLHLGNPDYGYAVNFSIIIPEMVAFILLFLVTTALVRGYFIQASHAIIITAFSAVWMVMWIDTSAIIQKLDTIALVMALMTVLPLALSGRGRLTYVYGLANIAMLWAFMWYARHDLGVTRSAFWEYLADNTIALAFAMVASSAVLRINSSSLGMAERLNIELRNNYGELEAVNEELRATIEELEATNEEFEAQNRELMESREELRASREELLAVFNGSHDAFIIIDEGGAILEVNRRMLEMFGLEFDEALAMHLDGLSPEGEGFHRHRVVIDRVIRGEASSFEWKACRPGDGTVFDVEVGLSRLNRRGRTVILAGVRDITLRKRIEEAVKESERKYRLITENATDMVFTMDMEFHFTYISPSVTRILGYSVDEAMALSFERIFTPESLARVTEIIERTRSRLGNLDMDRITIVEFEMSRRDGSRIWTENKFSFLKDESGRHMGFTGVTSDITARKKAEREQAAIRRQLEQAQKLEAVGTLAGGIAHDFNNILGGIMGSLSLMDILIDEEAPAFAGKMKGYLETAMQSSRRASNLTRQLLTLSRKSDMQSAPMDVTISLRNVKTICKNSFPKNVSLDFTLPGEGVFVNGDPVQIEQVLLNLCLNASHAMTVMRSEGEPQGGTLRVAADIVRSDASFAARRPGAVEGALYARISVRDNGVGMDEATKGRLFEPFFTTKSESGGTGLGLSMVYGILKEHGGSIEVESEPGTGSVFTVYLPAIDAHEGRQDDSMVREALVKGAGKVLVVDDEKTILRLAGEILKRCGYDVIAAEGGAEAVELFKKDHAAISAVLLDLSMPGMSGIETFERLKALDPGVRVLLTSGFAESESMKRAMEMGMAGLLRKPFSAMELSAAIKKIILSA
ncbi:MAG: PAS domain S-box protein [Spirochaetes bacterium]|nr:PAS domain S-box protein [Spirochaetota bacterium]